jgi:hypothetical protein
MRKRPEIRRTQDFLLHHKIPECMFLPSAFRNWKQLGGVPIHPALASTSQIWKSIYPEYSRLLRRSNPNRTRCSNSASKRKVRAGSNSRIGGRSGVLTVQRSILKRIYGSVTTLCRIVCTAGQETFGSHLMFLLTCGKYKLPAALHFVSRRTAL